MSSLLYGGLSDVTFENSPPPNVVFTTKVGISIGNYDAEDAATVTRSATTPVEQFTNQVHLRLRAVVALRALPDTETQCG